MKGSTAVITDIKTNKASKEPLNSVCQRESRPLLLADIGWSRLEAIETRARLAAFEEDWDASGMEGYDDL